MGNVTSSYDTILREPLSVRMALKPFGKLKTKVNMVLTPNIEFVRAQMRLALDHDDNVILFHLMGHLMSENSAHLLVSSPLAFVYPPSFPSAAGETIHARSPQKLQVHLRH